MQGGAADGARAGLPGLVETRREKMVEMENDALGPLKVIVEKHTVRYEVWPHCEMNDGKQVTVGFDLELRGTHDHGNTSLSPGCPVCTATFSDLLQIAGWILPKEKRPSEYDLPPFDQSLTQSGKGPYEVVLRIRIEHRHDFFGPIDDCERRCLKEMEGRLAELGVPGGRGRRRQ